MIELRWLERQEPCGPEVGGVTCGAGPMWTVTVRILQYRFAEPGGYVGEWRDVPTVIEAPTSVQGTM